MTYFIRTENGAAANVTKEAGLAEANRCMMDGKREIAEMTAVSGFYYIWYKDGRKVTLSRQDGEMPEPSAKEKDPKVWTGEETRIITVKGKRYVVGNIRQVGGYVTRPYVSYWSERDGKAFGPTRSTNADAKPGTVGRAIWDAVNR